MRVRLKPDTTYEQRGPAEAGTLRTNSAVRLKPDTTYEQRQVRLKPDATHEQRQVRLKPDATHEHVAQHVAPLNSQASTSLLTSRQKRPS